METELAKKSFNWTERSEGSGGFIMDEVVVMVQIDKTISTNRKKVARELMRTYRQVSVDSRCKSKSKSARSCFFFSFFLARPRRRREK